MKCRRVDLARIELRQVKVILAHEPRLARLSHLVFRRLMHVSVIALLRAHVTRVNIKYLHARALLRNVLAELLRQVNGPAVEQVDGIHAIFALQLTRSPNPWPFPAGGTSKQIP